MVIYVLEKLYISFFFKNKINHPNISEALLSALSRVLREEWKRSIELSTNIVYTFFCFSTYNEFHPVIIQYKIGSLCMDVIDYELKRYDQWKEKVEGKKQIPTPDKVGSEKPLNKKYIVLIIIINI